MLEHKKLPAVLLLHGPKGVGKKRFAHDLARQHLSMQGESHFDLLEFFPESKTNTHTMASMRMLIEQAALPPLEGEKRIFIIHEVDRLMQYCSNALLKTLEEPGPSCHFILLTSHPDLVLPTIRSRALQIPFHPIQIDAMTKWIQDTHQKSQGDAQEVARRSEGSYTKANLLLNDSLTSAIAEITSLFFANKKKEGCSKIALLEKTLEFSIEDTLFLILSHLRDHYLDKISFEHVYETANLLLQAEARSIRKKIGLEWFFLNLIKNNKAQK